MRRKARVMVNGFLTRSLLVLALDLVFASSALAAMHYVRKGASGRNDGSDWANAWTNTSEINFDSIAGGDVVYIAAGTYGALEIPKSGQPGQPIVFRRATQDAHGTATGWVSSYDAQVIIDGNGSDGGVSIGYSPAWAAQSNITIDGATRNGIWIRNAYYGVRAGYGVDNLTLRYLEIGDPGAYKLDEDGIQGKGDNLLIEFCNVHDNDNQTTHGDGIQWFGGNGLVIRYSIFKNNGQQIYLGEGSWDTVVNDVSVYYNIIYNRGGGHYNGIVLYGNNSQSGHYRKFYNNTFDLEALSDSGYDSVFYPLSGNATTLFANNAVIRSNANQITNTAHNNNAYDNAGAYVVYNIPPENGIVSLADLGFVDINAADYHLASGSPLIGKGVDVGLNVDFDGNPVSATPSIGAFEYETAEPPPPHLNPPSGLVIVP